MSDLENDLKRVLQTKADGDYVTGADVMLDRVAKGAVRLHRRRVGTAALSTLAIVTAGATLALNLGNITDANPPVISNTTTTPVATKTSGPQTNPSTAPTGGATVGPGVGAGLPTNTTSPTPTVPTTGTSSTSPTPPSGTASTQREVAVNGMEYMNVALFGENGIRVTGWASCDGQPCYPIMVSTDGGASFRYENRFPGPSSRFGVANTGAIWARGGSQRSLRSSWNGKDWIQKDAPGVIREVYGYTNNPVFKIGTGADLHFYRYSGDAAVQPWATQFDKAHDYSVQRAGVATGAMDGMIATLTSGWGAKPIKTPCKATAIDSQISILPNNVMWLMCPVSASESPKLLVSKDEGKTWKTIPAVVPRPGSINHIAAISEDAAIYYAGPTSKATLVKADGSTRQVVITGMANVDQLEFKSASVGYAFGGFLMKTTDGGLTWRKVNFAGFAR